LYSVRLFVPRSGSGYFRDLEPDARWLALADRSDVVAPELEALAYSAQHRRLYFFLGINFPPKSKSGNICAVGLDAAAQAGITDSVTLIVVTGDGVAWPEQRRLPARLPSGPQSARSAGSTGPGSSTDAGCLPMLPK
jgi:hypothetical protein